MSKPAQNANAFKQLGLSEEEETNLTIRHDLMTELKAFIKNNNLSTRGAGEILGISNSRVSDLINGHIDKFTIDYLVNLLPKAGLKLDISISTQKAA